MNIAFFNVRAEDESRIRDEYPDARIYATSLQEEIENCEDINIACVSIYSPVQQKEIDSLPKLQIVCTRSVGFDHIDTAACSKKGITVCNVPDYGSHVIAEHVFALLLSAIRHVREGDERVEGGVFSDEGLRGIALKGKTLGLLGTGKIGAHVARIAVGFGMNILAFDIVKDQDLARETGLEFVESKEELFSRSHVLSLHVPANEHTHHMVNADAIQTMKDGVILVNTARGSVVDSQALLEAVESGKVQYALLDVLEDEKNIEGDRKLIDHPHVITTPHIAYFAEESVEKMYEESFQSMEEFAKGDTPKNAIQ